MRAYVGDAVLQRARSYARDAVLELAWKAGTLEGVVAGTANAPYRCWVTLLPPTGTGTGAGYRPTASGCSCPVGARCKHVAAAMLASRERSRPSATPAADDRDGWRSAVRTLTAATGAGTDGRRELTPLALIVELRERVRRRSQGRWSRTAETFQAATRASDRLHITVRVGAPGKRGWVNAQVGWGSLNYRTYEFGYDPAQLRWFVEFETLARAAPGRYFTGDGTRMTLSEFASPLLWNLLADAPARGIRIVSGDKNGSVALGSKAEFELAASTDEAGALTLRQKIVRWTLRVGGTVLALVAVAATVVYAASERRFRRQFTVPPHPVHVLADSATIARGAHVAEIRGCTACHGQGFAGHVEVDDPMIGRLAGPNLTMRRPTLVSTPHSPCPSGSMRECSTKAQLEKCVGSARKS